MSNVDETTVWTPANIVTLIRIILIPVFVVAFISPWPDYIPQWENADLWKPWIAALIFIALSCTDAVDGYLARSRNEVTNFGKFIDPLADKILVAAALLALIELQMLPSWVALVILAREFIVSGLRMLVATHGVVVAASWYGKAKTVFQILAILLFIVKGSPLLLNLHSGMDTVLYVVSWAFMVVALILTIVSMVDYFIKCAPVLGFGKSSKQRAGAQGADEVPDCSPAALEALAGEVITAATAKGLKLSTAESCTGGLIAGTLTAVPGSSEAVEGGIVSYSNEVKAQVLGVPETTLARHGAVSSEVVLAMAEGSRATCGTDVAVSVSGIAGPGGAVPGKPVGTVWFGLARAGCTESFEQHFDGTREEVRAASVQFALTLLLSAIKTAPAKVSE